jgi:ribose transport system substrate-binding protein
MSRLTRKLIGATAAMAAAIAISAGSAYADDPKPNPNPECFRPWDESTKMISYPAKEGPYRLALVNGFAGNDWRIQMIQSLKAWAARPENAPNIKELKIVSTGADVAAQIAAIDNFIAAGFDAISFIAVNPTAFDAVIKRAERSGTVLVPFDNILDTDKVFQVNQKQIEFEETKGRYVWQLLEEEGKTSGIRVLEVRGLPGNSVDRDRSIGMHNVFDRDGVEIVTVVGNWDTGTVQKVVADALAAHGHFDAVMSQHGGQGVINAFKDAGHPMVPMGLDGENGTRRLAVENKVPFISVEQHPAMSAVAMDGAVRLLQGHELPVLVALPSTGVLGKDMKEGVDYFPDLPPSFNTGTGYPACFPPFEPQELLKQNSDNT